LDLQVSYQLLGQGECGQVLGVDDEEAGLGKKTCVVLMLTTTSQLKLDIVGLRQHETLTSVWLSLQNLVTACREYFSHMQFSRTEPCLVVWFGSAAHI
jgi:hypothetical protein